jgi:hypothetical protein
LKASEDFQPVIRNGSFVLYKSSGTPGYFQVGSGFRAGCADNDALATGVGQFLQGPLPARQVFPQVLLRRECGGQPLLQDILSAAEQNPAPALRPGRLLEGSREQGPGSSIYRGLIRMQHDGLVILKVAYHPNWTFTANGRPVECLMVLPGFPACRLGKGDWRISAAYVPDGKRKILLILACVGLIIAVPISICRRSAANIGSRAPTFD